jgi:TPR repeat protein
MYAKGEGVPKNDVLAVKWYRLAAEQDNANAQANLGSMYGNGLASPRTMFWPTCGRTSGQPAAARWAKKTATFPHPE